MFIFDDDFFTLDEYKYCANMMEEMSDLFWIKPLLKKINDLNYPSNSKELKSFLFELQIAYEFYKTNNELEYEFQTGQEKSSVDFRYNSEDVNCLIEAVSPKISLEVQEATIISEIEPGMISYRTILSGDQKCSLGHEMIKMQGKILEKACKSNGTAVKFPIPRHGDLHIVVVDSRNFLGDKWDYLQISYGPQIVPDYCKLTYNGKLIKGIFEQSNDDVQAKVFRERVHILAFCNFKTFDKSLFSGQNCYLCWNPWLFRDTEIVKKYIVNIPVFADYPFEWL